MDVLVELFLIVFDNMFLLNCVSQSVLVEDRSDPHDRIGEDMNVDVGTRSYMAGQHTADQEGGEIAQRSHNADRIDSHFQQSVLA